MSTFAPYLQQLNKFEHTVGTLKFFKNLILKEFKHIIIEGIK